MKKHIILTKKGEFHSKFQSIWDRASGTTLIAIPYVVLVLILAFIYHHSNSSIIQIICFVAVFSVIPIACVTINKLKDAIEEYIFDEFILPQIEQEYIENNHEDKHNEEYEERGCATYLFK